MDELLKKSCQLVESSSIKNHLNIFDFSLKKLKQWFVNENLDDFRAVQIFQWLYHQGERDFDKMSNISKLLRQKLKENFSSELPTFSTEQRSHDGTIKWSMKLPKGGEIETVYIPEKNRGTLCVSSQVGCCVGCEFCATGKQGFQRNLRAYEIVAQIWRAAELLKQWEVDATDLPRRPVTNVVFMGMGEPLLNTRSVFSALHILLDDYGFGFSKRRITVSTSGIIPGIYQLGEEIDVALAISLHAPNENLRSALMPINKRYPLSELIPALKKYCSKSNANAGGLTVEYILLKGINDSVVHARELAALFKGFPVKVNLIPWNKIDGIDYEPSTPEVIHAFEQALKAQRVFSTQRKERGGDIAAACGQLVGKVQKEE